MTEDFHIKKLKPGRNLYLKDKKDKITLYTATQEIIRTLLSIQYDIALKERVETDEINSLLKKIQDFHQKIIKASENPTNEITVNLWELANEKINTKELKKIT